MKTQGIPKKNMSRENDRFDRRGTKVKPMPKDKSSKKRLSIYDEFDNDSLEQLDYDSDNIMDSFDQ